MTIANAVAMAHALLMDKLPSAKTVVDATAGNGHDTLFLAQNTPADAVVWAFDLQTEALSATERLLAEKGSFAKCRLIGDCHSRLADYITAPVDVAMFNLGYLPGGDHCITTSAATTVAALVAVLKLLAPGGLVTVVAYPGFPAGDEENSAVAEYLGTLPQTAFASACWRMLNQRNRPPILYIIGRTGRGTV